ncbi:hypothetical protein [[Phormidium] sp. ETS-05]|uniref:hypothetical protein n=1 Tax=[Phormidium] sp. ETS-05 TaxID=222819 RepID=UPI0018EEF7EB|nr:hypothetical protein [[Phormidium] sp. ETS-05]
MKVLLDTHAFIWWDSQPEQLSKEIVEFLLQPETGTQKPGFFFADTVNCYFHNRNPVSFSGQRGDRLSGELDTLSLPTLYSI